MTLRAEVSEDLRTIEGTLTAPPGLDVRWLDLLSQLPFPTSELDKRRTWPGAPEPGLLRFERVPSGDTPAMWRFHAVLPRRYGASGFVPHKGLYVNGLWHPQPVRDGEPAVIDWDVHLELPDDAVAVLNGVTGRGTVAWAGRAERLALAVVPRGRVTQANTRVGEVRVLEQGRSRRSWVGKIGTLLEEAWPGAVASNTVIVETPDYRRLVRPGPSVLFLSSRAMRLSDGLWRYHAAAVRRGLLESGLPIEDPWERALAAAAISDAITSEATPAKALGWLSWIPPIDDLLYDGTLPYFSEVFDEAHPEDRVRDDLAEMAQGHAPARSVTRRIDAKYGGGTSRALAWRLMEGDTFAAAATAVSVDPALVLAWSHPCPEQDLVLDVREGATGWEVHVVRDAPPDAPPEAVPVKIDDQVHLWEPGRGADQTSWALADRPEAVVVDPAGLVHQTEHAGDHWPTRWNATVSAWIYELDLQTGRMRAFIDLAARRRDDTRWLFGLGAETDPENLVTANVWALSYLGPLQDRRTRPVRIGLAAGPSLLDPDIHDTATGQIAMDVQTWVSWDTREDRDLPLRGHRLWATGSAGFLLGDDERWWSSSTGGLYMQPIGGRVALVGVARLARSSGEVAHRKLDLGGTGGVEGIPTGALLGDRKVAGAAELRWHTLRNVSVPAGLVWLSDLQLSAGLQGGMLADGEPLPEGTQALGWNAGVATLWDLFGARPTLVGVWLAAPILGYERDGLPAAFLRFNQTL